MRSPGSTIARLGLAVGMAVATASIASCSIITSLDGLTGGATTDAAPVSPDDEGGKPEVDASLDATSDGRADAPPGVDASASATYRAAVLADAPLGYWRLDESAGAAIATDASGHGHDGVYASGVTLGVAGAIAGDTAAHFDGVAANIAFGDLFRFDATTPVTIEAWVQPEVRVPADNGAILARSLDPDGWGLYVDTSLRIAFERENATNDDIITGPALATTPFHHLVGTYDGSSLRLYYDAVLVAGPTASGAIIGANANFFIGAVANATDLFFKGVIDEPAVYDRALTDTQIHAHYQAARLP